MRFALFLVPLVIASALLVAAVTRSAEEGLVLAVIDGDTIRVRLADRTETVRLIGIDTPEMGDDRRAVEHFAREARQFVNDLAYRETVRLETDPLGDTRDRFGRALRYVFLADGRLLNAEILRHGYGHAYTRFPFSRRDEFVRLEREARTAEAGLWATGDLPRLRAAEAAAHAGERVVVCGRVASTRYLDRARGRPTFLNLGAPYPEHLFTIVIWGNDRKPFGTPENDYDGQDVCVTGTIELFRGKPQINARRPESLGLR